MFKVFFPCEHTLGINVLKLNVLYPELGDCEFLSTRRQDSWLVGVMIPKNGLGPGSGPNSFAKDCPTEPENYTLGRGLLEQIRKPMQKINPGKEG
jgi:hypothetical protein